MPSSGSICPPFLPPVWPIRSPPLATSIRGHQYLQGSGSPGKDWEDVGCPLCAQSFPGSAITELAPCCARVPVSCSVRLWALHLLVPLEAPCCPISCPLPTPELVSAAGTDLAPVRGHSPTASLSASPKEQGQHPSLGSRASRHSLDQPLAGATSLAFPSTLRVGLFAGSCGGSSQVAPGAAFSVFCLFKCFIVAWSQRGGLRNRWAAPVSLPGTVPGWCSHPAVPSTGWPGGPCPCWSCSGSRAPTHCWPLVPGTARATPLVFRVPLCAHRAWLCQLGPCLVSPCSTSAGAVMF